MAYCSLSALTEYLGHSSSDDDALLTGIISRAEAIIDQYTHRTFEATADTTRYFDADCDVDGPLLYFDEDICSITTVTNGDGSTISGSYYVTEPRNRAPYWGIRLKSSSGLFWEYDSNDDHENAIGVTGKWAWSQTAPADVQHACLRLAAFLYFQKDSQVFDTTATPELGIITVPIGMPKDVKNLLEPYRRRS